MKTEKNTPTELTKFRGQQKNSFKGTKTHKAGTKMSFATDINTGFLED